MSLLLMELPLLILTLPRSIMSVGSFLYAVLFIVGCLLLDRVRKSWGPEARNVISFKIEKPFVSILMAAILGVVFFIHWSDISVSRIVQMVQSALHLSDQGLLIVLGIGTFILSALSVISFSVLFRLVGQANATAPNPERNLLKSRKSITGWDVIFYFALVMAIAITRFVTTPFLPVIPGKDASVFLYIGRMMLQGKVPYRDLFDHKGPILYFIQYLGALFSIPGTFSGVWALEIINLMAFFLILHKMLAMITERGGVRYFTAIVIGNFFNANYYPIGTEEWSLPWLALVLYICVKYFYTEKYQKRDVVLLGVGGAVVALMRVNNVGVWVALIPLIVVDLIRKKRAKELFPCIGYFLLGFFAVCLPVLTYLLATGSFDYFVAYYIDFNFAYIADKSNATSIGNLIWIFMELFIPWIYWFPFAIGARASDSHGMRCIHFVNFIGFFVAMALIVMSGWLHPYYAMLLWPFFAIPIASAAELFCRMVEKGNIMKIKTVYRRALYGTAVCLLLCGFIVANYPRAVSDVNDSVEDYILAETEEDDDVLLLEAEPSDYFLSNYFRTNRYTQNKFFYQRPPVNISDKLYEELRNEINTKPSDLIVVWGVKAKLFEKNIPAIVRELDEQAAAGVYEYEEFEDFFAYKRVKNEE